MTSPLEQLLSQLAQGDTAAVEETFRRFGPYLRKVVRRHLTPELRAKFDSEDIVQSVWATLIERLSQKGWDFRDVRYLQAFLVKATRNRFIDRLRQVNPTVQRQRSLRDLQPEQVPPAPQPRPSQVAQGEELWERVLALCPPEHEQLVRLKRDGLSLEEIGRQTGLHPDSVRRALRMLARRLAFHR